MYSQKPLPKKTDKEIPELEAKVSANIGLVHLCARRFLNRKADYEDLFQIGCVGLLKAVANFDESRGLRFSTYAVPMIIGEIRGFFRSDGMIKVSRSLRDLSVKIAAATAEWEKNQGRSPSISELSAALGEEEEKISEAMGATQAALSLTAGGEGDDSQIDIPVESAEESITDRLSLWQTIELLPDEDKKLLGLRYYMNKTQKETAELLGCSQVQISRKEKKILLFMRSLL